MNELLAVVGLGWKPLRSEREFAPLSRRLLLNISYEFTATLKFL
jgi:hypothetical protein